jgi:hypothetical protein
MTTELSFWKYKEALIPQIGDYILTLMINLHKDFHDRKDPISLLLCFSIIKFDVRALNELWHTVSLLHSFQMKRL